MNTTNNNSKKNGGKPDAPSIACVVECQKDALAAPERINERLREQITAMERAVAAAKVDALQLFSDLEACTNRARRMADSLASEEGEQWLRRVSRLMDLLEKPQAAMDSLAGLGMLSGRRPPEPRLEWLFGDGS